MRYIIMCGFCILLANCTLTTPNQGAKISRYGYGSPISAYINRFGLPNKKVVFSEGNTAYFYTRTNPRYANVSTPSPVQLNIDSSGKPLMLIKPGVGMTEKSLAFTCTIMFIVNKQGIIIDSNVQGEGCNESIF
ncbi:MAG: hypothetical protein A3F42_03130 [Gammaproteobacteria bacterium RIFCSPHIGHO2_12_FULL_37_34]|nr:MAG: hypothetical protein A3F42_03130 [Gammaproteobacteria bacterium RIFCSPHIGHO2_12_FULL_37_34]